MEVILYVAPKDWLVGQFTRQMDLFMVVFIYWKGHKTLEFISPFEICSPTW